MISWNLFLLEHGYLSWMSKAFHTLSVLFNRAVLIEPVLIELNDRRIPRKWNKRQSLHSCWLSRPMHLVVEDIGIDALYVKCVLGSSKGQNEWKALVKGVFIGVQFELKMTGGQQLDIQ